MKDGREVYSLRFPMVNIFSLLKHVNAPDHFIQRAESKFRHDLADFISDKKEKVDDVFRRAREFFSQLRVLRCNTNGTGVEMTLPHHDASHCDERSC